ncbi:MAG: ketoacyl-ACP synthase III [Planctomycetes bacterium]|nr:ketoacyl-ACP synthase III [Planctomycetota bacterium]
MSGKQASALRRVGIAGLGTCMPKGVLSNADLEKLVDTSDEWIVQRTGIRERRVVAPGENTSDISVVAARQALERAGVDPADLDLVIEATVSPDHLLPATACKVAEILGAKKAGAFDLSAACSGFMYGLTVGAQFVRSGMYRNVLVIGAESLSRMVNYEDRNSCIIFGDGAGAAVIRPLEDCGGKHELLDFHLGADGTGYEFIWRPSGGVADPLSAEVLEKKGHFMIVRGREVYRFAVAMMTELVQKAIEPYGMAQLGFIVPHQVNERIIDAALERLEIPRSKCIVNIDRYGNTSAASVPVALAEAAEAGSLEPGKIVILVAFGAGLAWSYATVRW